ncbi:immunoglobulin-like domain-containing receptor 2 [Danio aesculapii]|uniref:immunoglobulin-like domain-containing receptor 2 n=1 Tax=Danio aesculapii TaxID=1142201 RepID=UPI0024C01134|nr:immunoglobulin-like domain-containing receptor 2 [Danio aesculapii]
MPTMVPITPPSLIEPYLSSAVSMENGSAERSGFHLQPVPDHSSLKMLQYVEKQLAEFNPSHTPSICADSCAVSELSSLHHAEADFRQSYRHIQKKALPALPDPGDPADLRKLDLSPAREGRYLHQHRNQENPRWNPRSEHLQRKVCVERRRSGSVELEEFALGYTPRGRRHTPQGEHTLEDDEEQKRQREQELDQYTLHSSKHQSPNISPARRLPTPPPVPGERPECWENNEPGARDQRVLGSRYNDALLSRLLERKTNAALSGSPTAGRTEASDSNSRKSSERLQNSRTRSPCQQMGDSGDKHTHLSRDKHTHLSGDQHTHPSTPQEQNRPRKVSTLLSRDSLVV